MRNLFANFAVTISLVTASAFAAIYKTETNLRMLNVEAELEPALTLSTGAKRPWIVNPMGYEKEFPVEGIFFAILPAIGFTVLGSLVVGTIFVGPRRGMERACTRLRLVAWYLERLGFDPLSGGRWAVPWIDMVGLKGPGYHLDLFVRGAVTLPACAILGLPLSVASTVPSITHVISLTTYEVQQLPQGERKVPVKVVEQRATNFLIHVLIGCALFLAPVLKFLPRSVLQGVFFYMGIASLTGNNLFDRLFLWLVWEPKNYPAYIYIQKLPVKRVHLYTFVQLICLAILYGLKEIKATSVVFPFFMASLAIIRKAMRFMFTAEELKYLDSYPDADEEE
ncbi:unnamed protein product, partial [Durusdinium trenchii]